MKVTRKQLRQIIKEELGRTSDKVGSGLPSARDLSKKLSSVPPDEAIAFPARVLNNMSVSSAPEPEPPAEQPLPSAPEDE